MLAIYQKSNDQNFVLMQTNWSSQLNPVLSLPPINGVLLDNIVLVNGNNVINHKLGKTQQGWIMTDINAGAAVYRSQPFNDKTLTLTSGAACIVSLWVY